MKNNVQKNNKLKLKKFIDKNFGDEIEYCLIREKEHSILVYGRSREMTIFRIENMDHLIQELIMLKEERDFLLQENDELLDDLEAIKINKIQKAK